MEQLVLEKWPRGGCRKAVAEKWRQGDGGKVKFVTLRFLCVFACSYVSLQISLNICSNYLLCSTDRPSPMCHAERHPFLAMYVYPIRKNT